MSRIQRHLARMQKELESLEACFPKNTPFSLAGIGNDKNSHFYKYKHDAAYRRRFDAWVKEQACGARQMTSEEMRNYFFKCYH